jgi:hypothetical protein
MDTRATISPLEDDGSFSFAIARVKDNLEPDNEFTLTKKNAHLQWLCHASTRTGNDAEKIAELDQYFARLQAITFATLNERYFFDAPQRAPYFVDALIRNTTIKTISFGSDFQREAINSHMEKYLSRTTSLVQLELRAVDTNDYHYDNRKLLDNDILHIAKALRFNTSLEILNLSYQNKLTDTGIRHLIDAIKMNSSCKLREVKIEGIPLSKEIKYELRKILEPNAVKYAHREMLSRQQREQTQAKVTPTNINIETPKPF